MWGRIIMKTIGNILWFIFGGFFSTIGWLLSGIIWCITIIGIPYGKQCFKYAKLTIWPFKKEVDYGGGIFSSIANIIWLIFFGWEMAIGYCIVGLIWCITIIGIPFGKQFFKLAKLSLAPFGAKVENK